MNQQANQSQDAASPLLEIQELTLRFGGITALDGVNFTVRQGEILGLIGPNGAGKTTLFNCLSRLYTPDSGDIRFQGQSILALPRHRIATGGIGRTFQNVALFDSLSVRDNILVAGHARLTRGIFASVLRTAGFHAMERQANQTADELMQLMLLEEHAAKIVKTLPFPIRKRVELARALMLNPRVLLLDEPAAGLNHSELDKLKEQILQLQRHFQLTVLLVEHHMSLVMAVSDHVVVLDFGQKIADGTPEQVRNDPQVIRAYLGAD